MRDLALAPAGARRIAWAARWLPVLGAVRARLERERPLAGVRLAACLPVTPETAVLALALQAGGADVLVCGGAAPALTQDDVAAALAADHGLAVHAVHDAADDTRFAHLEAAADFRPQLVLDDGAELVSLLHAARREGLAHVLAATEAAPVGVLRLRALEDEGKLALPVVAVGESAVGELLAGRHGAGQAAVDAIVRATGLLVAGSAWTVAGYGPAGRGVAARARGLGAVVTVAEADPVRALEAALDGFAVAPLAEAVQGAAVVVTATGARGALGALELEGVADGAVLANAGDEVGEIEGAALRAAAQELRDAAPLVQEVVLRDGRSVLLLAGGRPVAAAAGGGQPALALDGLLAVQALAAEHALRHAATLERRVYPVPAGIDREVARVKLATMGFSA